MKALNDAICQVATGLCIQPESVTGWGAGMDRAKLHRLLDAQLDRIERLLAMERERLKRNKPAIAVRTLVSGQVAAPSD